MSAPANQTTDKQRGVLALLARIFWMALGNFALMICAANILMSESSSTRISDIIFLCVVPAMIIVRFLDIKFLDGQTVTGEPATLSHWRKYTIVLIIISAIIWAVVHMIANFSKP